MANTTCAWQIMFGPDTKSNISTALGVATISGITVLNDPGTPVDETDTTLLAHFSAAITMAQGALAALTGDAPNAKVIIWGYRDLNVAAGAASGSTGSKIKCEVQEFWPY